MYLDEDPSTIELVDEVSDVFEEVSSTNDQDRTLFGVPTAPQDKTTREDVDGDTTQFGMFFAARADSEPRD